MKTSLYRIAEIAVGCCAAIALANLLGLQNAVSAGVVTILSILDTKKETLRSALERFATFAIAVAVALAAFSLLGYGILAFGVYLFVFTLCTYRLGLQASLPICTVLVSHFWTAGHMAPWLIGNEALLMLIGTAIGVGLNLFLPRDVAGIRRQQRRVEDVLRAYFLHLSGALAKQGGTDPLDKDLQSLRAMLRDMRGQASRLAANTLFQDMTYYQQYVDMRRNQADILDRMADALRDLPLLPAPAERLSAFMWEIAQALHENNDAVALLDGLHAMLADFRQSPLPQTREEFEARAVLYGIMIDTEHFLLLKKSFVEALTPEEKRTYQPPVSPPPKDA